MNTRRPANGNGHPLEPSSLVHALTSTLANPYSTLSPYSPHAPSQHVNAQGYTYSSTYNSLAASSRPSTSYSLSGPALDHVSSNRNTLPSRGAPLTPWYTAGKSRCTHSGCAFTGSANTVEVHMMDRHLIYPPGWHTRRRQSDWDADPSLKGKPIPIMGTNARLDTPEDLEAWIAERKRRWPTAARVSEKKRKLEEAVASGGLHPDHFTFARDKRSRPPFDDAGATRTRTGRGRGGGGGGRGRGRGRGAGGGGRNRWHDDGGTPAVTSTQTRSSPVVTTMTERQPCVPPATDDASHLDSDSGSDDDAPEVLSTKRPPGIEEYASSSDAEPEQPHGHSPSAPAMPPLGTTGTAAAVVAQPPIVVKVQSANYPRRAPPPQPKNPPRNPFAARASLLRNLLLPEIRMTVSNLSQAIHFLVDNDFLENVELKPGQATEKRIEVVGEQAAPAEPDTSNLEHASLETQVDNT